jgi:excisionase family DNA binding protein
MQNSDLSVKQVQEELGISKSFAFKILQSEGLPHLRIGRRIVIQREDFLRWKEAHRVSPTNSQTKGETRT